MAVMGEAVAGWRGRHLEGMARACDADSLLAVLAAAARELGFDYCAYGMRLPLPLSNPATVMVNNYPQAWQARYAAAGYLAVDPTVAHGVASLDPLVWSEALFAGARPLWEEARGHQLRIGWAQSSRAADGSAGMLTLARSHERLSDTELARSERDMIWLAHAAHEAMVRLQGQKQPRAPLSVREAEVLRWMADGKTSSEAAIILGLSERTVNFHVANALLKLGAANKTAAVVKAALLGLL
ncbi:autoinducer binding domain-containing protein [Massilia sp. ST3]|uniref:autoinducer binding domain-containing protein n=1 Tax=Massilia sp. ST3 TaxID=2824903 RepID=UPI001B82BCE0|nr:autoinducer binding domain-containing protein [Massilia sp. ST3]MBQ5950010.1 autoinducer binding domain-containing protein [Massilia sp. ST3]